MGWILIHDRNNSFDPEVRPQNLIKNLMKFPLLRTYDGLNWDLTRYDQDSRLSVKESSEATR